MSWLLTFVGFAALILLHELGHFAAAKAVGMRVERFSLFFPPHVWKRRGRGETEYALGVLPLGGYVKITGMNPREEIPPEVAYRAYYRQPVWKRIVVILAGPAVNIVLAFLILWPLFTVKDRVELLPPTTRIAEGSLRPPASSVLRPGDRIVSVDGRSGGPEVLRSQIARHRCPGEPQDGCVAATPARVSVMRGEERLTLLVKPRYSEEAKRPLLGFAFHQPRRVIPLSPTEAAAYTLDRMWFVTKGSVSVLARIFEEDKREQISGIVGTSSALNERFKLDTAEAVFLLGIISLSLAIINLFPFLPLDGGHIFWALAEKVRRKPIPFEVMERSMAVGFVLVITLFVIGLSNDIGRLRGEGFGPPR